MLEALFGNKNVQKILLSLFVNGKCYGTQLQRQLDTALTPLQNGLLRLEKGGIIVSYYEGKTRLYQFNPAYPLLNELEQLLKKAYTLLPANEKKSYYITHTKGMLAEAFEGSKLQVVLALWERLSTVKEITFDAKTRSKEETGWNGKGKGEVAVVKEGNTLIFNEKGTWKGKEGGEVSFSNVFRWTLDRSSALISLDHLRLGADRPIFLFHLAPSNNQTLSSVDSHLCANDSYFGQIHFSKRSLRFHCRVIGPKKNEEIDYYYT